MCLWLEDSGRLKEGSCSLPGEGTCKPPYDPRGPFLLDGIGESDIRESELSFWRINSLAYESLFDWSLNLLLAIPYLEFSIFEETPEFIRVKAGCKVGELCF